jgi:tetratricopeptide (TPR) repeat protein
LTALLFLSTAALFARAVGNGFTLWDDDVYLTANPLVGPFSRDRLCDVLTSFVDGNYHPLTILTYLCEYALVGFRPWLYHLTNVLAHATAAGLAYRLGRAWFEDRAAAFLAALAFAVHPLRVESVAWVAERKDVLCAVFSLGALLAYHAVISGDGGARERRRNYSAALGFFVLALLSKPMALSVPAILTLYLACRRRLCRATLAGLAPFWVLTLAFTWINIVGQARNEALQGLRNGSVIAHGLTVVKAVGFYARKTVAPLDLSPLYVFTPPQSLFDADLILGALCLTAAAAAAALSWRRRRHVLLALGFSLAAWAPVSGIVPSAMPVADRYTYLPSLGLFWAAILGGRRVLGSAHARRPRLAAAASSAIVLALAAASVVTFERIGVWTDNESLWRSALRENPRHAVAYAQLAVSALRAGRYGEARDHAEHAVRLGNDRPQCLLTLALAYRGLGETEKEAACTRAILEAYPSFLPAQVLRARHLTLAGSFDECEDLLRRLRSAHSDHPGLLEALGDLDLARLRPQPALERFSQALRGNPRSAELRVKTALCLAELGEALPALEMLGGALSMSGTHLYPDVKVLVDRLRRLLDRGLTPLPARPSPRG